LQAKNYPLAAEFARRIIDNKAIKQLDLQRTAWIVYAHAQYEMAKYAEAEKAYLVAISRVPAKKQGDIRLRAELTDRLAASIYKQGEVFRSKGEKKLAAYHFMRVSKAAPSSAIRQTAEYDAATLYMEMKDWPKSVSILEGMRRTFPKSLKFAQGVSSKLVLAYTQMGSFDRAAKEINTLASYAKTPEDRRKLMWQSAEMYEKAGQPGKANNMYIKYIAKYPKPFAQQIEAQYRVAEYYKSRKSWKQRNKWLNKLIVAEKKGGALRTDRTRYLAASAAFELAQPTIRSYKQVKLKIPLKKNLRIKKQRMESSIKALKKVMAYKVAEFSTASTYYMGEIYNHLAQALMESQKPSGLSADELEQYEILLEEQAYPFEEKAIKIHSSNVKRTRQKIYDEWIQKSMKVLESIQPVRYAKHEKMESYVLVSK